MMANLAERQLLLADQSGGITVGYQNYSLGEVFDLDDKEKAEVNRAVAGFSRHFVRLIHQQREDKAKEMAAQATIEPEQLREGKFGLCLLEVPAETYTDKEGKERWRGGGQLLVELRKGPRDSQILVPLTGNGSLEREAAAMVKMEVDLTHEQAFVIDEPPAHSWVALCRMRNGLMRSRGMDEAEADACVRKTKALWHFVKRAFRALDSQKANAELRAEFGKAADITPQQFCGIGVPETKGIACLQFQGAFQTDSGHSVADIFFLAERAGENGDESITVTDAPSHVAEFLGATMGKPFKAGNDFQGLPSRLGRVLRAIKGQLRLASELEKS